VEHHVRHAEQVRERLLLDAVDAPLQDGLVAAVFTYFFRMCSMAQVRKPPVPQAGSSTFSPSFGSTWSTMNCGHGARRVELAGVPGVLQVR
jgi:hypothetical protein